MMISRGVIGCCLLSLIIICPFYQKNLQKKRVELLKESETGYVIPSRFTVPASLDFKGIIADFLYLKISTYVGGKMMDKELMDNNDADYLYKAAQIMTDLDPWFWDAYLMNSMILAWDFKRVDLANKLLEKATKHRSWDFKPPYYLGFNYFYFKKNNDAASKYFFKAVQRGNAPKFLLPLATRLSVYQNQLIPAILILDEQLQTTYDPVIARQLRTRLDVLKKLAFLEKKVSAFKKVHGRLPKQLNELVISGLIEKIPDDPYGGKFYITKGGRVFTTSKMRFRNKDDYRSTQKK